MQAGSERLPQVQIQSQRTLNRLDAGRHISMSLMNDFASQRARLGPPFQGKMSVITSATFNVD